MLVWWLTCFHLATVHISLAHMFPPFHPARVMAHMFQSGHPAYMSGSHVPTFSPCSCDGSHVSIWSPCMCVWLRCFHLVGLSLPMAHMFPPGRPAFVSGSHVQIPTQSLYTNVWLTCSIWSACTCLLAELATNIWPGWRGEWAEECGLLVMNHPSRQLACRQAGPRQADNRQK